jgi:hypothetical protein
MYFDKSDFKIDTIFSARKRDYPNYKTYELKDKSLPMTDLKNTKAIMIYHSTRCRSIVLLQDFFHTGYFATINEPCIKPTDEHSKLIQDLIKKILKILEFLVLRHQQLNHIILKICIIVIMTYIQLS